VTSPDTALLEVRGISKTYGRFTALEPTDITVTAGSIHGFLGKNGAGKSTLVKIIAGSTAPTSGSIVFRGEDITQLSLARRRERGIHLLSQHAEVVADLSVAENLLIPDYPTKHGLVQLDVMRDRAQALLDRYGLQMDVDVRAGSLSVPDQRRLSIVRTLVDEGALAMLDEPTTALTQAERASLFSWMRELNEQGHTFVFISHFNNEIQAICNEVSVLRDGRLVAQGDDPRRMTSAEISRLVSGDDVTEFVRARRPAAEPNVVVRDLRAHGTSPISFEVGRGEILGLVGLPESGAQEVARALAGLHPVQGGEVSVAGKSIRVGRVRTAINGGIAYLTNDRLGEGIVGPMSVKENLRIGHWPLLRGLVDPRRVNGTYDKYRAQLAFRVSGPEQPVEELSGGNQQKILLGRLLALDPKVLILDEPTLGVDVATKEEVHRLIDELTDQGLSVILLAYDTDEMVRMVDRVIAFQDGHIARELTGDDITADNIIATLHHADHTQTEAV
jgi:simple sugar transport system ATP-binding protein